MIGVVGNLVDQMVGVGVDFGRTLTVGVGVDLVNQLVGIGFVGIQSCVGGSNDWMRELWY